MKSKGSVSLVGAGCGTMDLITVRGLERLQQCDAVVYDDLIDLALLEEIPASAQRIYMGKRQGKHSAKQQEISQTLVQLAQEGKHVVRLKGGDPFVFGRGGEEVLALQQAEVPFEEIPGISSCIAIPAQAGIPVTHRGISRSFHVITAHTAQDEIDKEKLHNLAALDGTLVFLMGLSRLEQLADGLVQAGKSADTSVAVISGGNAPHPMTVRGTLRTIAERVRQANVQAPAVIVVGEVAAMNLLSPLEDKPLAGAQIGITGTPHFVRKLERTLQQKGAQTVRVSSARVVPLQWTDALRIYKETNSWLVFTSANGVRIFFDTLHTKKVDLRKLAYCKFAVIGKATGETLAQYGFQADLCPDIYNSETLAKHLCKEVKPGETVILLRAKHSAAILPEILTKQEIPVQDIAIYDIEETATDSCNLSQLDYLTFASAGGVHRFFQKYGRIPQTTMCVCIGAVTGETFEMYDTRPYLTAESAEISSIVQAVCQHYKSNT